MPRTPDLKAQHHLASGALSGLTSAVCLQPLDLLKTRLQQGGHGAKRRRVRTTVRQIIADEGAAGLWRGTVPTVVRNVPGVALYFYTLSSIRASLSTVPAFASTSALAAASPAVAQIPAPSTPVSPLPGPSTVLPLPAAAAQASPASTALPVSEPKSTSRSALIKLSSGGNLLAGAVARTSVGFVLNPFTVLKTRYESSAYAEYRSLPRALLSLVQTSGVRGLFQGFTATAARDAPYAGIYVVFYEKGKEVASRLFRDELGVPNAALHSGSAVTASVLATIITSPADCVKTRMQVAPAEHSTIRRAVARIYSDRGLPGFFSGSALRVSRKAASSAIAWTVYEGVLLFLQAKEPIGPVGAAKLV
ncbi:hypothetical protein Q5752_003100 [Cryptotrichosporon argae]